MQMMLMMMLGMWTFKPQKKMMSKPGREQETISSALSNVISAPSTG